MFHTLLTTNSVSIQETSSRSDGVSTQTKGLDSVRASPNTAIHPNLEWSVGGLPLRIRRGQVLRVFQGGSLDTGGTSVFRSKEVRGMFANFKEGVDTGVGCVELTTTVV